MKIKYKQFSLPFFLTAFQSDVSVHALVPKFASSSFWWHDYRALAHCAPHALCFLDTCICIQYIYQQLQLWEGFAPLRVDKTDRNLSLKSNCSVITAHPAQGQRTRQKLMIHEATLPVPQEDGVGQALRGVTRKMTHRCKMALAGQCSLHEVVSLAPGHCSPYSVCPILCNLQATSERWSSQTLSPGTGFLCLPFWFFSLPSLCMSSLHPPVYKITITVVTVHQVCPCTSKFLS